GRATTCWSTYRPSSRRPGSVTRACGSTSWSTSARTRAWSSCSRRGLPTTEVAGRPVGGRCLGMAEPEDDPTQTPTRDPSADDPPLEREPPPGKLPSDTDVQAERQAEGEAEQEAAERDRRD